MYKKEKVIGYEEYEVDNQGIIYGKNGRALKASVNPKGYHIVVFRTNGKIKGFGVHQIVARQFVKNPDVQNKTQVNHIDGNKSNNCAENLEWVTPKENAQHSVNMLGNCLGSKNSRSKSIYGIDVETHKIKYRFSSIIDGAKFFAKQQQNPRYVQTAIWKALNKIRKTYKKCIWEYGESR